ncbi:MAG: hypothetical protein A3K03_05390 [Bdellovibrionales bacterium RIFOXYD1_FULL_44_7]|nr:MAG: hypothetical protein A3K03_05390 [Bdellovibrionales bacterium RIFOXYD1_FULL_44_7]
MTKELPLIVLAGGQSTRMGIPKGLFFYDGEFWLDRQIKSYWECGLRELVVVLGYRFEEYQQKLSWSRFDEWFEYRGLQVVVTLNREPQYGPFSSLCCGLTFFHKNISTEGVFVSPVDVPCPDRKTFSLLKKTLAANTDVFVCRPKFEEKRGHPILLSRTFAETLLLSTVTDPSSRLDLKIQALDDKKCKDVDVDDKKILFNMNTPEDFANLRA